MSCLQTLNLETLPCQMAEAWYQQMLSRRYGLDSCPTCGHTDEWRAKVDLADYHNTPVYPEKNPL